MKKSLLIFAFALASSLGFSQTGSWYLGGSLGVGGTTTTTGTTKTKGSAWNVSPEFGVNVTESFQVGLGVNLTGATFDKDTPNETVQSGFNPLLYGRNFWKVGDQFSVFAGVYLQYLSGNTKENDVETSKNSGFAGDLKIGAGFHPSERWTILGTYGLFNYTTNKTTAGNVESTQNDWALGINTLGPVFNVGIYYTIIKK